MPGGRVKLSELIALLNVIPMEITFVDAENINRFFNEGPKIFSRPKMALGREVFSCHPPKIEPMVRQIIDDFRSGRRDEVSVWMEKSGKSFLVRYMAVRDKNGKYLGTVELVQNMEFAKSIFGRIDSKSIRQRYSPALPHCYLANLFSFASDHILSTFAWLCSVSFAA